jgi:Cu/Ag efflux pump CusA
MATAALLLAGSILLASGLGRTFLPDFNEGSLTLSAVTLPGTSLEESDRLGRRLEQVLLSFPEVVSTARRQGRAELDEHAQDVNSAEIDVRLRMRGRRKAEFLKALRAELAGLPGMVIIVGQPLSHRIDHMLSGTRAAIAVKLFGDDLAQLRRTAEQIRAAMAKVEGVVDLSVEQQVDIPQLRITPDRDALARYGLRSGDLAETIETAFAGHQVTQMLVGQRTYALVVRYPDDQRADAEAIGNALVDTPVGPKLPLRLLADIRADTGPNVITRESAQRKIVVMANLGSRDLRSVIRDIRQRVEREVKLPPGYHVVYGGQFESEGDASRILALTGVLVIAGIFLLLYLAFHSVRDALLIMVNLPLALIGGVAAVKLQGGVLSLASLVGFITLFGIATRNGIMMLSHFRHLSRTEGAPLLEAVERGSLERLSPILMTALCAGLALIPLVLSGDQPGNEIQAPMGVVILGGLLSSTALNLLVLPAMYWRFASTRAERQSAR